MTRHSADASAENPRYDLEGDTRFLRELQLEAGEEARRRGSPEATLDLFFYVFLRRFARFGYFIHGPITIDVQLIEDIIDRTLPPRVRGATPVYADDFVRFSATLMDEVRRSGRPRIDALHFLIAFMRTREGLPGRVFGELGVTPEQVLADTRVEGPPRPAGEEKLYSPEEAAEYLQVHVQTVRAWIRSGRLRASRLAGQRALRIRAADLREVLEPVEADDGADEDR